MARNVIHVAAPPERVFEVLADPACYPRWVVGARRLRGADPDFPRSGTRFYHEVGVGPLRIRDHTEVLEVERPRRLVLRARARPLGTTRIDLDVVPEGRGSRVTLVEVAADPLTVVLLNPLTDVIVHVRNDESLRRLRALAERRGGGRRAG